MVDASASTPLEGPSRSVAESVNLPPKMPHSSNFFQANPPLGTTVKHALVDVDEEGCYFRETPERRYDSLHDLVRGSPVLKTIYSEWPSDVRVATA